jgi:HK97 family phage major capsid protein
MTIEEMRAKRKELVEQSRNLRSIADEENRELLADEATRLEEWLKRGEHLTVEIAREERLLSLEDANYASHQPPTKPDLGEIPSGHPTRFRSFGEQLQAVIRAAQPGGTVDPRLNLRAVMGMSEGSPSDGGFLVQTDFATELLKRTYTTGRVAGRCRRIQLSGASNSMKINAVSESSRADGSRWGGVRAYWTAEAGDKTNATPAFRQIELNLKKLTGLAYVTDELLQDAVALEQVLMQAFSEEIGFKLDDAIIRGTGAGQPLGVLASACLVTQDAEGGQDADTFVAENAFNMYSRLYAPSMGNAVWFINQSVWPQLFRMGLSVGLGGAPIFLPAGSIAGQPYNTLLGLPIIAIEQADTIGDLGDVILADMSQYLLADKGGIQSASSIHVRFVNDESVFRFVYRVDGQPWWQSALTPFNSAPTQSPFVVLAAR